MRLNLTAPVNQLGYGVVGLNTALALERLGHEPALWPLGAVDAPPRHHAGLARMLARARQCFDTRAPSLRVWHQFDLAQHVGKGEHCAMPVFELDRFRPAERHHLLAQDIVFANSHWAGRVLEDNGVPAGRIHYAPLGVDPEIFRPDPGGAPRGPGPTRFLNVGKWELRKGHDVLLEAFEKAFSPADDVLLLMHCTNPCFRTREEAERYNGEWASLYRGSRMAGKIELSGSRLPDQEGVARLMASCDCGVFPSRAEGWNLEAAEMLALGRHVVLTDYAAHSEFADASCALLVGVGETEEAHDGVWFDARRDDWGGRAGRWARLGPDQVDQLVECLRAVHVTRQSGGGLPFNAAGAERMRHFTWENTAREIAAVLGGEA